MKKIKALLQIKKLTKGENQMKKSIIPVLLLSTMLTACSSSTSAEPKEVSSISVDAESESETTQDNEESTAPEETIIPDNEIGSIEEQVLLDQDGLKVTAMEMITDSLWGEGIKLLIENNTEKNIGLGCNALIVNDYMISDLFSSTIAAGKKSNENLYFSSSVLEAAGITNIGQIEIYFHVFDGDSYETITDYDCVTIKTSNFDAMDTTMADEGEELLNQNGIRIVGKYVDENSFWGTAVLLYIENTSGKNVGISCDDMSINGFMVSPLFSSTVYDGKKAIDDITIMSSDLEDNGIDTIEDIELKFHVYDSDSYSTIFDSEPISFSLN